MPSTVRPWAAAFGQGVDLLDGLDARWVPRLTEAVVALDAMLQVKVVSTPTLERRARRASGQRGVRQAAQAVSQGRVGVRSTWESRLRMLHVLELGFAVPVVNRAVFRGRLRDRLRGGAIRWLRRDRTRDRWTIEPPEHWYGMPA